MSTDCVANIIPTGDYNSEWPQKSLYSSSSSCDNRMSSLWYVDVADEPTQVTMLAPMSADGPLQTIIESGDFTGEQNKILHIHDLSKTMNGHLPNDQKPITNSSQCEFGIKKYLKFDKHQSNNTASDFFDNDIDYCNKKILKKSTRNPNYNEFFDRCNSPMDNSDNMEGKIHKNVYKHVPHKDRPPLIVARRNARERRRVQAVNTAFIKLRKIVPLENNRGKRISKVKTLQTAIDYISGLQILLKQADMYHHDLDIISKYRYRPNDYDCSFDDFDNEF